MKHILKPALSLFLVAAISTAILGLVHRLTLEPIAQQRLRTQERLMGEILSGASAFRELDLPQRGDMVRVFEGSHQGAVQGYLVEMAPQGYAGEILLLVGISHPDGILRGLRILRHQETPGLGAHITRESFLQAFIDRPLVPLELVKTAPLSNQVQALTGATISSRAVVEAVNEAMEWYLQRRGP